MLYKYLTNTQLMILTIAIILVSIGLEILRNYLDKKRIEKNSRNNHKHNNK